MNLPSNCSIDLAAAIRKIALSIKKHKEFCYPGSYLDKDRCHAALTAINSDANSIIALLDSVIEEPPTPI